MLRKRNNAITMAFAAAYSSAAATALAVMSPSSKMSDGFMANLTLNRQQPDFGAAWYHAPLPIGDEIKRGREYLGVSGLGNFVHVQHSADDDSGADTNGESDQTGVDRFTGYHVQYGDDGTPIATLHGPATSAAGDQRIAS